ncbi:hypothetical protein Desca_0630 [Desulfotomaculum nigrificans CO-1-SRB]|uniref:Uncharacterized protein n=1 Tax=Desulfotomaculum nigrificans (strain DSM 14880 / VKM B-2319 / CO-1-SRB) TaxID=868595 RepID=F6B873_DESCC|nr:hypothetical protein [Desulfotomaculum nigrificans]AEF93518.1 hypothetical protein Desca_0630 [Desulfotomaculum nigrificans CO-1-SRB]
MFNALAAGRLFFGQTNQPDREQQSAYLLDLLLHCRKVTFEAGPGLTPEGLKGFQEILKQRERVGKIKVVQFPTSEPIEDDEF